MQTEQLIHDLVRPLVRFGAYKNETMAIKDLVATHIEKKLYIYNGIIRMLQKKHGKNFETFTNDIKNKTTTKLEDDWMEWKGALEMRMAWSNALKEVIESESQI